MPHFINKKLDELQQLAKAMRADLAISELEKLELKYKLIIRSIVGQNNRNFRIAFDIAKIQKSLGLVFKYKSYGIKACTPLGYSIFLLNRGEGFSFQNHPTFKVELFRVLDVLPGGYLFVAGQESWKKVFEKKKFEDWLKGKREKRYDKFKVVPTPGDVIKINKTGIVHTAIGCFLEEYGNTSSDMVQRLHDQNYGRGIPRYFSRNFVEKGLRRLKFPERSCFVSVGRRKRKMIKPRNMKFGEVAVLNNSEAFVAACYRVRAGQTQSLSTKDNYVSIYVTNGEGLVSIFDNQEKQDKKLSFRIKKGETTLLVPKTVWFLENSSKEPLSYSFLSVNKANALK